jgi:hypothetical protein
MDKITRYKGGNSVWTNDNTASSIINTDFFGENNTPLTPSNKLWIKVGGVWKEAVTWIKVAGVWKEATPKTKVAGAWV